VAGNPFLDPPPASIDRRSSLFFRVFLRFCTLGRLRVSVPPLFCLCIPLFFVFAQIYPWPPCPSLGLFTSRLNCETLHLSFGLSPSSFSISAPRQFPLLPPQEAVKGTKLSTPKPLPPGTPPHSVHLFFFFLASNSPSLFFFSCPSFYCFCSPCLPFCIEVPPGPSQQPIFDLRR